MDTPIPRISHLEPPEQAARRLKVVLDALEVEWGLTPVDAILEYQRWQYDEVVAADEAQAGAAKDTLPHQEEDETLRVYREWRAMPQTSEEPRRAVHRPPK